MTEKATRRDFLRQAAVGAAAVSALAQEVVAQTTAAGPGGLPTRVLGRTGQRVSILALGGWHIGADQGRGGGRSRIMHAALDEGITFFDNAWDYHDGSSEELMGRALADGRPARQGLPHDQELRARLRGLDEVPGGQPAPAANRPPRPLAVPRDGLRQRSRLGVREGRPARRRSKRGRRARSASSASPATRTRASTSRCSASRTTGTRPRCPST